MNLKSLLIVIVLTLAIAHLCNGQCLSINLIRNSDLEEHNCCPTNMALISCANNWSQPLATSTSDYFNLCAIDSLDNPGILPFYQHAFFGNGYVGILCDYYSSPFVSREYLQGELMQPLIAGECYHVELWVLLSAYASTHAIDALGVFFSDTLPKANDVNSPFYFMPQISNPLGVIISDTIMWTKISGEFVAIGDEQYFTIGTFTPEGMINKTQIKPDIGADYSYYFFDHLSLCPCYDTLPPEGPANVVFLPNVFSPNEDGKNDFFYAKGENISQLDLKIYSRWGNLVFECKDPSQGWNGRFHGKDCAEGVYFYTATVTFIDGSVVVKKGNVTIVR